MMFDDGIRLFSAVVSTLTLIRSEVSIAQAKKRATLDKLSKEFTDFGEAILGWYNRIAGLVAVLMIDLQGEEFTKLQQDDYRKSLATIQLRDEFYSRCRNFVVSRVPHYLDLQAPSAEIKEALGNVAKSYSRFEFIVFSMKSRIWESLWIKMNKDQRLALSDRIANDFRRFRTHKDAIIRAIAEA